LARAALNALSVRGQHRALFLVDEQQNCGPESREQLNIEISACRLMALFANSLRGNGASAVEGRPTVIGVTA
jgi:hypothetical protein